MRFSVLTKSTGSGEVCVIVVSIGLFLSLQLPVYLLLCF